MLAEEEITVCKGSKMPFGYHQSNAYKNSNKMTTQKAMLCCQPDDEIRKINHLFFCYKICEMMSG